MSENVDQKSQFKEIMGRYPTGVTVITTNNENGDPIGMTVNSFSSLSMDPLMILWSIRKDATEFDAFVNAEKFAVNILDGDNIEVGKKFASKDKSNRFNQKNWHVSSQQLPVLNNVYAVMECETVQVVEAGDHIVLIGQVTDLEKHSDTPMLYYNREMGHIPADWASQAKPNHVKHT